MKRGDILWCAGFKDLGKVRPWVIVQNNESLSDWPSITACPLTTGENSKAGSIRLTVSPDSVNKLESISVVMVDKVSTLPRDRVKNRQGRLSADDLRKVEALLLRWLGL